MTNLPPPRSFAIPVEYREFWDILAEAWDAAPACARPTVLIRDQGGTRLASVPRHCDIACVRYPDVMLVTCNTNVVRVEPEDGLEALRSDLTDQDIVTLVKLIEPALRTPGIEGMIRLITNRLRG
jgi:hypothetical protein